MTHHVEQHFVTIADQQRFHLVSSAARAAMSAPGGTSSAAAQPIRTCSYDSRNPKVAASMSGSSARERTASGSSPISASRLALGRASWMERRWQDGYITGDAGS